METTTARKLRAELKDYLELAAKEPIRITRPSGDSFIILHEDAYAALKNEIESLQRRLLGAMEALAGETHSPDTLRNPERLRRFKRE